MAKTATTHRNSTAQEGQLNRPFEAARNRNARNAANPSSTARDMPFPADPATAPVTDASLCGVLERFQEMARELLPQMQRDAINPNEPSPTGGAVGQPARLAETSVIVDPSLLQSN